MKKRLSFLVLATILFLSTVTPTLAAPVTIMATYSNTMNVSGTLSFTGQRANLMGSITGRPGTTSVTMNVNLSRKNSNGTYTTVKSWDTSTTTEEYVIEAYHWYVERGYTYRITVSGNVTRGGTTEYVSGYAEDTLSK